MEQPKVLSLLFAGDGEIDYMEFLAAVCDHQRMLADHTLAGIFGGGSSMLSAVSASLCKHLAKHDIFLQKMFVPQRDPTLLGEKKSDSTT